MQNKQLQAMQTKSRVGNLANFTSGQCNNGKKYLNWSK